MSLERIIIRPLDGEYILDWLADFLPLQVDNEPASYDWVIDRSVITQTSKETVPSDGQTADIGCKRSKEEKIKTDFTRYDIRQSVSQSVGVSCHADMIAQLSLSSKVMIILYTVCCWYHGHDRTAAYCDKDDDHDDYDWMESLDDLNVLRLASLVGTCACFETWPSPEVITLPHFYDMLHQGDVCATEVFEQDFRANQGN